MTVSQDTGVCAATGVAGIPNIRTTTQPVNNKRDMMFPFLVTAKSRSDVNAKGSEIVDASKPKQSIW